MPLGPVSGAPAWPAARDAPGWYGKLAMLGDFAHRRLPADFVGTCDAWLAGVVGASRTRPGDGWLDAYLTAPVLRFAWAPGVAGPPWWFGVLMPSCDSVGRYWPLLVARPRPRPPLDRIALDHLEAWYDHLAGAATRTLADDAALEAFEQALADAPPWPGPGPAAAGATELPPLEGGGRLWNLGRPASLCDALQALAARDLCERFAGCSVWWRKAGETPGDGIAAIPGLPGPAAFAALLAGG